MENKFAGKTAPATQPKTDAPKKPRAPVVKFDEKVKVYNMIIEGKGTIEEIVAAGVSERVARISVKTLLMSKMIKQSFVKA